MNIKVFKLIALIPVFTVLVLVPASQKLEAKTPSLAGQDAVLARIDGDTITKGDFMEALKTLPPRLQWAVHNDKNIRIKFLDNLVTKKLLLKAANKAGVKEDQEMKRKIEEFKNELLLDKYLKNNLGKIEVSDKEAKTYYNKHKRDFITPEEMRAKHILVKEKSQAEDILKQLKNNADFAKLAKKYSIDKATASKGGELGFFTRRDMVKSFSQAAFSLKPGEISPVVKTPFGYHIIKAEEKRPQRQRSFEEVKQEIKSKLLKDKEQAAFDALVAKAKKNWKVETHPELLDKMFHNK